MKQAETPPSCPAGKYWVRAHTRKRISKNGVPYEQHIKGYCCCHHSIYQTIADEEKLPLDHLYFALTVYGEARGETDTSKRMIAWIIRNRFTKKEGKDPYQKIVLRKSQFACWTKGDPNYEKLKHPGKKDQVDKAAWEKCKIIFEAVRHANENENPTPHVCHYFSGPPKLKWQEHYFDLPNVPNFHFVKLKEC